MRAADVAALAAAGLEIGFHTLRHDVLPALDDAALEAALRDGREALERPAGREITTDLVPAREGGPARRGRGARRRLRPRLHGPCPRP